MVTITEKFRGFLRYKVFFFFYRNYFVPSATLIGQSCRRLTPSIPCPPLVSGCLHSVVCCCWQFLFAFRSSEGSSSSALILYIELIRSWEFRYNTTQSSLFSFLPDRAEKKVTKIPVTLFTWVFFAYLLEPSLGYLCRIYQTFPFLYRSKT